MHNMACLSSVDPVHKLWSHPLNPLTLTQRRISELHVLFGLLQCTSAASILWTMEQTTDGAHGLKQRNVCQRKPSCNTSSNSGWMCMFEYFGHVNLLYLEKVVAEQQLNVNCQSVSSLLRLWAATLGAFSRSKDLPGTQRPLQLLSESLDPALHQWTHRISRIKFPPIRYPYWRCLMPKKQKENSNNNLKKEKKKTRTAPVCLNWPPVGVPGPAW